MHCFNSITVQLRLLHLLFGFRNSLFQFHNGTIKTLSSTLATCMKARFNSITVQLRRMYTDNNTSEMEVSIP